MTTIICFIIDTLESFWCMICYVTKSTQENIPLKSHGKNDEWLVSYNNDVQATYLCDMRGIPRVCEGHGAS
jgi:hypothetical protein